MVSAHGAASRLPVACRAKPFYEANIYALLEEDDRIAIYTSTGQTVNYVKHDSRITIHFRLLKARGIIEAVQHIHSRGLFHSD